MSQSRKSVFRIVNTGCDHIKKGDHIYSRLEKKDTKRNDMLNRITATIYNSAVSGSRCIGISLGEANKSEEFDIEIHEKKEIVFVVEPGVFSISVFEIESYAESMTSCKMVEFVREYVREYSGIKDVTEKLIDIHSPSTLIVARHLGFEFLSFGELISRVHPNINLIEVTTTNATPSLQVVKDPVGTHQVQKIKMLHSRVIRENFLKNNANNNNNEE